MVPNVSQLLTKTKTFKLNPSLTCADFGIYVATCVICHEQYVGQTSNKFSKRWSAHRSNWNKQDCKTDRDKDQMALSRHCSENHGTINKPPLHEAYTVTFVEKPRCHSLDICENKWYHLIDAQINIQNMILPPHPCEIIITMLCVVWLNPMLSSALCASFSLKTSCLLPPQHLQRTRGRFKCVPQRLTARTWLTIFLYRC